MEFRGIEDALGKWIILRFTKLPKELITRFTGLSSGIEDKWLQFKLQGIDNLGIWVENPYFRVSASKEIPQDQREALETEKALVLIKWQYVATIIYLGGQKDDRIPLGFSLPSRPCEESL